MIAGNSDTGSAKNVAFTSARNAPYRAGVRRMNASPSSVSASPDRGRPSSAGSSPAAFPAALSWLAAACTVLAGRRACTGGIADSPPTPHSAPANDATSAR